MLLNLLTMLNLILFGPPGSGKGTQSSRIACRYNLVHLSSGELFRQEVKRGTQHGLQLARFMNNGLLVPDQMVITKLYRAILSNLKAPGFVFDGFPRTIHQATILDQLLEKNGTQISIVFSMQVDEQELFNRMMERGQDSGRDDDNERTILRRLKIFQKQTQHLKEYYLKQNKISEISGMAPVKVVSERIANVVHHYLEQHEILQFA
jgi:adenylate kinase